MLVGPSRKETFLNSRVDLELASLGKSDRVIDVAGHGYVTGWSTSQGSAVSVWQRRRQQSLELTTGNWRVFGAFAVG